MRTRKIILSIITCGMILAGTLSDGRTQDLSRYQALFMSKFIDYVKWPEGKDNLVVGIVGNSRTLIELQKMMEQKNKAVIKKISSAADVAGCDMVFLPADQSKLFSTINNDTMGRSILIITEGEELARQGAVISFYVDQGKLKFFINKSAAEARNLQISGALMSLAKLI